MKKQLHIFFCVIFVHCILCTGSTSLLAQEEASNLEVTTNTEVDTPKQQPLELSIPMPIGECATEIKIPQRNFSGTLISQLAALKMTRLDTEHFQMQELIINFYKPDGQIDYRIDLPQSVFNTQDRIIKSDDPVKITGVNFELTGEKMQFDTVKRKGKVFGNVCLKIKDLTSNQTIQK